MEDIRDMLTFERVRGMYLGEDKFSKFSEADLRGVLDWLHTTAVEIFQMRREVEKELRRVEQKAC